MDYRLEKRGAFRVVGVKTHTTMENGVCFQEVPHLWAQVNEGPMMETLGQLMNGVVPGTLGVSHVPDLNSQEFDYYAAVTSDAHPPEGMDVLEVPAAEWAVFSAVGPCQSSIQKLQQDVGAFVVESGLTMAFGINFEVYLDEDITRPDYHSEVWIPLRR